MQESYIKNFPGSTRVLVINLQKKFAWGRKEINHLQDDIFIRGKTMGGHRRFLKGAVVRSGN